MPEETLVETMTLVAQQLFDVFMTPQVLFTGEYKRPFQLENGHILTVASATSSLPRLLILNLAI